MKPAEKPAFGQWRAETDNCAPDNLFDCSVKELAAHGYEPLTGKFTLQNGDVVSMDKEGTLWCYTDSAAHLAKNLPKDFQHKLTVYRKVSKP